MDHFNYQQGQLHAEGVSLEQLAAEVGTPFYCYSTATLQRHVEVFRAGLEGLNHRICFAVKANSNLAVLATLSKAGVGADVVSEGEIRRALAAGITPSNIVFSGVGKTREEMRYALAQDIFQFNVESLPELEALNDVAKAANKRARIALRVNPDVDAGTHAKITTGKKESKFGVPFEDATALYAHAATLEGIAVQGVSMHIGSQLTTLKPFADAYAKAKELVHTLREAGHAITTLDLGGGLGIPYEPDSDAPPLPQAYGETVRKIFSDMDIELIFEPGRLIAGNAGILVSRVIYVKESYGRRFVIVDAAMNDLLRPAMYDAHHDIVTVKQSDAKPEPVDIVGPVCESGDTFAVQRPLPLPAAGELIAFRSAGAYGAVMSSSYNSRLLTPEVLVQGEHYALVRPRPSYQELLGKDVMPGWLTS